MQNYILNQIKESIDIKQLILENKSILNTIKEISLKILEAYKNGKKTIIAGNGGSAADAQHIAAEFVSRLHFDRPGLSSIAITTDTSILTAISNDYGYEKLFARQLQAIANKGDIFIAISTSGNSPNIIEALKVCNELKLTSVGLTGQTCGKINQLSDYCINIPTTKNTRIQEAHIMIGHIICAVVEESIFGKGF